MFYTFTSSDIQVHKDGIILYLSSISAISPTPLLTIYSATKAFIDFLSRAIFLEKPYDQMIIQSILPYYVSTNISYNMKTNLFVPKSNKYVRQELKTIGQNIQTSGYPTQRILNFGFLMIIFCSYILGIEISNFLKIKLNYIRNKIYIKSCKNGVEFFNSDF